MVKVIIELDGKKVFEKESEFAHISDQPWPSPGQQPAGRPDDPFPLPEFCSGDGADHPADTVAEG